MAGRVRYLIQRDGRFYARIVVPAPLRKLVGKVELNAALGSDRRAAIRALPKAVARFQDEITKAARAADAEKTLAHASLPEHGWEPLEAARKHYLDAITFDAELRDGSRAYAKHGFIDDRYVSELRDIVAGSADDSEILHVLQIPLRKFNATDPSRPDWRRFARVLAQAELAALEVSAHRDDGEADPPMPAFLQESSSERSAAASKPGIAICEIFKGYARELHIIGKGRGAESRWAPVIESLVGFLGHQEAQKVKRQDVIRWKDELLRTLAPKTVRDSYVASARAAFSWATDNLHLDHNPFSGVKVRLSKKPMSREKGFTDREARAVLKASRTYRGSSKEHPTMSAAKQWTPLLAAYTGARIGELVQLRVEDIRKEGTIHYRLDAVDAYERKLVKQIEVASATVVGANNKPFVRVISVANKRGIISAKVELDVETAAGVQRHEVIVQDGDNLEQTAKRAISALVSAILGPEAMISCFKSKPFSSEPKTSMCRSNSSSVSRPT